MQEEQLFCGRCLCGSIEIECRFSMNESLKLVYCYCDSCRKSTGAPKLAVFPAPIRAVKIRDEKASLTGYESSSGKTRYFCKECGASIYSQRDGATDLRLRAGLFDRLESLEFVGHIYFSNRAEWYDTYGSSPRFTGKEPGRT